MVTRAMIMLEMNLLSITKLHIKQNNSPNAVVPPFYSLKGHFHYGCAALR